MTGAQRLSAFLAGRDASFIIGGGATATGWNLGEAIAANLRGDEDDASVTAAIRAIGPPERFHDRSPDFNIQLGWSRVAGYLTIGEYSRDIEAKRTAAALAAARAESDWKIERRTMPLLSDAERALIVELRAVRKPGALSGPGDVEIFDACFPNTLDRAAQELSYVAQLCSEDAPTNIADWFRRVGHPALCARRDWLPPASPCLVTLFKYYAHGRRPPSAPGDRP